MKGLTRLDGPLWRILTEGTDPLAGAQNPEGRFHHDGQPALYAALTPEGAAASLTRYLGPDDPLRMIVELEVAGGAILDLDTPDLPAGIDGETARHRWDIDRKAGRFPPTWTMSDRIRAAGWDGFLYPSRLRPDLRNVCLFHWNEAGGPILTPRGQPEPWHP